MTHAEFVSAYRAGAVRVNVDPTRAASFVTTRLWLPLVRLPVLGIGVALALIGWIWTGFIVIAIGTFAPMLIRRSAPHFVVTQALEDASFYGDVLKTGVIELEKVMGKGDEGRVMTRSDEK